VETGTFTYRQIGAQLRAYNNSNGGRSDTRYPDTISTASYTYRAINSSSGILTLTAVGSSDLTTTGGFTANNASFVYLFESDSTFATNNVVIMDLTFSSDGTVVTSNAATVTQPGGSPLFDTIVIPTAVTLTEGGAVPENYNPVLDPNRPSKIAPVSLNNRRFQFTSGNLNPAFDFTIQFTADAVTIPANNIDEIGFGVLRVAATAVDNAISYTYRRIGGTDDATLVVSGSGLSTDGTYTLSFAGTQSGTYTGLPDGLTVNPADESGRFIVITP
jgi:hypothetical protein